MPAKEHLLLGKATKEESTEGLLQDFSSEDATCHSAKHRPISSPQLSSDVLSMSARGMRLRCETELADEQGSGLELHVRATSCRCENPSSSRVVDELNPAMEAMASPLNTGIVEIFLVRLRRRVKQVKC
jgi:hypothetical protein